jgi:hypothetical protein
MAVLPEQAQREAAAALAELGLPHAVGAPTCGGLLKPDLVVLRGGERVALSLDGPERFSVNAPHRPLGEAILGWRLLVLQQFQVPHAFTAQSTRPLHARAPAHAAASPGAACACASLPPEHAHCACACAYRVALFLAHPGL